MTRRVRNPARAGRRQDKTVPLRLRLLGLLAVLVLGVGCPCVKGPVNASPGLRWWLFSNFGAQRMCPEMLKRGAPLKLSPNGNVIGRFFPTQCQHEVHDDGIRGNGRGSVTVHFAGTGYAWTPVAGRVGFSVKASIDYEIDFYMGDEDVYVWAKNPLVKYGPEFQVGSVENKVVNWGLKTPAGWMVDQFGSQIVSSQVASGFTVLHGDSGDDFTLGILQPPAKPRHPFDTTEGDRYVFANETTEIRANQVDFIGPFEVADDDQALFFRMRGDGTQSEAMLFPRGAADLWRDALQRGAALAPPSSAPIAGWPIAVGSEMRRKIKVPRGQYVVVIDNSAAVGIVTPPWNPLSMVGGNTAVVSYTAELGDEDDDF